MVKNKLTLIYLAAGRGSRLKLTTSNKPKCLVEVNKKPIIEHNLNFFNKFSKVIIVTGYKSRMISNKFKNKGYLFVHNKKYKTTNMVYSAFLPDIGNNDVVISYGDIIFDYKIFNLLKKHKSNLMPVNKNWLNFWRKRMNLNKIKNDAENITIESNMVKSIGEKIIVFPKYQFMGLIKLKNKEFLKLKIFFNLQKNKKIDFTNFLNLAIKNINFKINISKTSSYWYEIDNNIDLKIADRSIKEQSL